MIAIASGEEGRWLETSETDTRDSVISLVIYYIKGYDAHLNLFILALGACALGGSLSMLFYIFLMLKPENKKTKNID